MWFIRADLKIPLVGRGSLANDGRVLPERKSARTLSETNTTAVELGTGIALAAGPH